MILLGYMLVSAITVVLLERRDAIAQQSEGHEEISELKSDRFVSDGFYGG